jgi:hypothetical protein
MCQPASGRLQRPGLATGRGISDRGPVRQLYANRTVRDLRRNVVTRDL